MLYIEENEINPKQLSPLNLAFIGDAVYEIMVREMLVNEANRPVNDLHTQSVKYVSAKAQTEAYDAIKDILTQEEMSIFKRGRNAKVGHNPKSASHGEYHTATGVETLFGYLYMMRENERLRELFKIILDKIK